MVRYARIQDGTVLEVVDLPKDTTIDEVFPSELKFRQVPARVEAGMIEVDGKFVHPPSQPLGVEQLLAYAANKRWEVETGGITLSGVPVATDDRSKIMIMGARVAAQANPDWTTVWHGSDGGTYPLNAAAMVAISDAVEAHVNATFATFAALKADVDAGLIKTLEQVDQAWGWAAGS